MISRIALLLMTSSIPLTLEMASAQDVHHGPEQSVFSADNNVVKHSVSLPKHALEALASDPYVSGALKNANLPPEQLSTTWFKASAIHLAGPNEVDFIVMGECPMCGANVSPFWVLRPKDDVFQVVLFTGALGFTVKHRRSSGYREIETASVSMQHANISIWRFDGHRYKPSDEETKNADATR
jgi:hypothetical protein